MSFSSVGSFSPQPSLSSLASPLQHPSFPQPSSQEDIAAAAAAAASAAAAAAVGNGSVHFGQTNTSWPLSYDQGAAAAVAAVTGGVSSGPTAPHTPLKAHPSADAGLATGEPFSPSFGHHTPQSSPAPTEHPTFTWDSLNISSAAAQMTAQQSQSLLNSPDYKLRAAQTEAQAQEWARLRQQGLERAMHRQMAMKGSTVAHGGPQTSAGLQGLNGQSNGNPNPTAPPMSSPPRKFRDPSEERGSGDVSHLISSDSDSDAESKRKRGERGGARRRSPGLGSLTSGFYEDLNQRAPPMNKTRLHPSLSRTRAHTHSHAYTRACARTRNTPPIQTPTCRIVYFPSVVFTICSSYAMHCYVHMLQVHIERRAKRHRI